MTSASLTQKDKQKLITLLDRISIKDMLHAGHILGEGSGQREARGYFYNDPSYKVVANSIEAIRIQLGGK